MESVGDPLGTKLLTSVLSVIAGSVDVILVSGARRTWSLVMPTGLALAALAITYCSHWFVQGADHAQSTMRGVAA